MPMDENDPVAMKECMVNITSDDQAQIDAAAHRVQRMTEVDEVIEAAWRNRCSALESFLSCAGGPVECTERWNALSLTEKKFVELRNAEITARFLFTRDTDNEVVRGALARVQDLAGALVQMIPSSKI